MRDRFAVALAMGLAAGAARADVAVVPTAAVRLLDGRGAVVPEGGALSITMRVPNDATLPRAFSFDGSADARDLRLEIVDPAAGTDTIEASLESVTPEGDRRAILPRVLLHRGEGSSAFRSPFLRLVASQLDADAPGITDRVLRAAIGDRIRVVYRDTEASGWTVGEDVLHGRLRIRIVRTASGGLPPIGTDAAGALAQAREQVAIASEIWSQCAITFGDPLDTDVAIVDPPPPATIAVADVDGLPARGGGTVRLRVDGRPIAPITTSAGARPVGTALAIASAIGRLGFRARVFENERAESGVFGSADVIVRRRDGSLAAITTDGDAPLSTDRQSVSIGAVDLGDGLTEFDNMTALTGTLEERALIRAIADEDESTIDVLVVAELSGRTREGEAFLEAESAGAPGSIVNTVILAREGIARARTAFTIAHEIGHVILDQPLHPDHLGPDRPWLLMDSNTSDGSILGPIRLTEAECRRARERSGPGASPALLRRGAPGSTRRR